MSPRINVISHLTCSLCLFSQFIDEYLRLAVVCNHLEVVLDVIAFALSALKHATAVVLHTLQSGVASFHTIVLSLLNEPHSASDSADEQDSEMFITATGGASEHFNKREVLCREATRWLHVMFELHHQLRPIVSERTQAHLDDIILALYPLSSVFVAPLPVPSVEAPVAASLVADESTPEAGEPMDVGVDGPAVALVDAPALAPTSADISAIPQLSVPETLTATDVLALCADKWGRPKQPRSDLGKRAKGYFATRNAAAAATASSTAPAVATATAAEGDTASSVVLPVDPSAAEKTDQVPSAVVDDGAGPEPQIVPAGAAEHGQGPQSKDPISTSVRGADSILIGENGYTNDASADDEEDARVSKSARL